MAYPKQLISTLNELGNECLNSFFVIENRKYFSIYENFNDMISDTLQEYGINDNSEKSEIQSVYGSQIRARRLKKKRWLTSYQKNMEKYSIVDSKHPFYSIHDDFNNLPGHQFLKLYDSNDLKTVIENYHKNILQWQENDKSLLIEYPLVSEKTKNQVISCFKIDLIIDLLNIILNNMGGNIKSYFARKPEILLQNPFFAPHRYSVPFEPSLNAYVADLIHYNKDDLHFQMLVNSDRSEEVQKMKVFDSKDNQLLLTLINNIKPDFYESKSVTIEIGSLAKALNDHPNKHCYEDVKHRLHNMARTGFRICKKDSENNPLFTFNFFDNVSTPDHDGKEYAIVTFGNILYEAITKRKMVAVTSSSYNLLEQDLSRLIYHNLQKERITLYNSSVPDDAGLLPKSYDYSFFQRVILFKSKRKADNIQLIKKTLDEFVAKKIAIHHYEYSPSDGLFFLFYFNLTVDEQEDLLKTEENKLLLSDDNYIESVSFDIL